MSKNHVWSFSTVGGVKRVNLESGDDLVNLSSLDPKLWTVLSCPVDNLEIDKATMVHMEADKDGQIRVPEVIAAVNWMASLLKQPGDLLKQDPALPLAAINDQVELGRLLRDAAKVILKNLGKENSAAITVDDTGDTKKIFAGTPFNGDGVVTEDSTTDTALLQLLAEIGKCAGTVADRGGKQGINKDILDNFVSECGKFAAWNEKKDSNKALILPFGDNTPDFFSVFINLKPKIDDYFMRCNLAAFDPQSTAMLNLQVERVGAITSQNLSDCLQQIAGYPLSSIEAGKPLPVNSGINPAWSAAMSRFAGSVVSQVFPGKESITEAEWQRITDTFAPYGAWLGQKDGTAVEPLGIARVKEILAGAGKGRVQELIDKDNAVANEVDNMLLVDKLVRFYRDLFVVLKNFVTFHDFYSPGMKAIFQAGTLYIEQRSCDLCIRVRDMPKHGTMASFSGMYLVYCDCISKATNEKMTIAAALTNGDVDNLVVGKNALFYDRKGLDWDATIVKIVDNPISIRQAFFSPYRKVSRLIETQINKAAAAKEASVSADLGKGVEGVQLKPEDPKVKKDPPAQFDLGKFVGIFAAIGLALGALGTALTTVAGGFMGLVWWKMPLAILGIILLISGPSMIMAYMKLRKRNLAPLLDANGWAINAQVIVNISFGNTLTHLSALPPGSRVNIVDPFSKKKMPVVPYLLMLLVVAAAVMYGLWKYGYIHF